MSQKPRAPGPPSSSTTESSQITPVLPATSLRPQSSNAPTPPTFHETTNPVGPVLAEHTAMVSVEILEQKTVQDRPEQTSSRALGVQSILNPSQPESHGRLYPSNEPGTTGFSPTKTSSFLARNPTPPTLSSPNILKRSGRNSPGASISSAPSAEVSRSARRVLTPRSPRAASFTTRRSFTANSTFSSQPPSLPGQGRIYTAEPGQHQGAEIPPLPTSTSLGRQNFSYPSWSDPSASQITRTSVGPGPGPAQGSLPVATLQGESTSTSHLSYGQYGQTSPNLRYDNPSTSLNQYHHALSRQPAALSHGQAGSGMAESQREMGQGPMQITLDTEQGRIIMPVEVDVQQASKVADEKRKRNAGASARFRERRKQKEKEASATIAGLEKDIRDIAEERDYYINERNFYRDFIIRNMGHGQLPPRPPSPQSRRLPPPQPPPAAHEATPQPWQESVGDQAEPIIRNPKQRRTGGYQSSFASPPAVSPMIPPQVPNYSLPGHPPPFQPSYQDPRTSGPPSQPTVPAPPRSTSYDPFRRDPYDRSWNPGR